MLLVTLFAEISASLPDLLSNLSTVIAERIARVLKISGATQTVLLDIQRLFTSSGLLHKFKLHCVMKRCFILLSHFVVVKDFRLHRSASHVLSAPLMLEYLRIFGPIFFALNEQRKVKEAFVIK